MNQHHSTYYVEKKMQHREAEIARNIRKGLYAKRSGDAESETSGQIAAKRGFWRKWFGSRRLDTSLK